MAPSVVKPKGLEKAQSFQLWVSSSPVNNPGGKPCNQLEQGINSDKVKSGRNYWESTASRYEHEIVPKKKIVLGYEDFKTTWGTQGLIGYGAVDLSRKAYVDS